MRLTLCLVLVLRSQCLQGQAWVTVGWGRQHRNQARSWPSGVSSVGESQGPGLVLSFMGQSCDREEMDSDINSERMWRVSRAMGKRNKSKLQVIKGL